MKPNFLLSFGFLVSCLTLSSCASNWDVAEEDNALQPGVQYEVRKPLPAKLKTVPENQTTHYFTVDAPSQPASSEVKNFNEPNERTVRTTAYCHNENDHLAYGSYAAGGAPLRFGMVCSAAADWSRYPLGTRFRIKSQPEVIYEVDDYGSALVGSSTIDLYRPTMGSMNAWGVRNVDIEILQWGSFQDSMRMMRDRVAYAHVRHMMMDIQHRLDPSHAPAAPPMIHVRVPLAPPTMSPAISQPALPESPAAILEASPILPSGPPLATADSAVSL